MKTQDTAATGIEGREKGGKRETQGEADLFQSEAVCLLPSPEAEHKKWMPGGRDGKNCK